MEYFDIKDASRTAKEDTFVIINFDHTFLELPAFIEGEASKASNIVNFKVVVLNTS